MQRNLPMGASLHPLGNCIETQRMVKSATEIAAIRESVKINSQAFKAALKRFQKGVKECDFAAEIEYQMRVFGAEKPSFDTIAAYRENSARPHARPGGAKIDGNGLLLVDMGTFRGGYASDMTRCVHLGKPVAKRQSVSSGPRSPVGGGGCCRPWSNGGRNRCGGAAGTPSAWSGQGICSQHRPRIRPGDS